MTCSTEKRFVEIFELTSTIKSLINHGVEEFVNNKDKFPSKRMISIISLLNEYYQKEDEWYENTNRTCNLQSIREMIKSRLVSSEEVSNKEIAENSYTLIYHRILSKIKQNTMFDDILKEVRFSTMNQSGEIVTMSKDQSKDILESRDGLREEIYESLKQDRSTNYILENEKKEITYQLLQHRINSHIKKNGSSIHELEMMNALMMMVFADGTMEEEIIKHTLHVPNKIVSRSRDTCASLGYNMDYYRERYNILSSVYIYDGLFNYINSGSSFLEKLLSEIEVKSTIVFSNIKSPEDAFVFEIAWKEVSDNDPINSYNNTQNISDIISDRSIYQLKSKFFLSKS